MPPTQLLLEGPAIEPLLRRVREEHGPDVRIVKAERVRVGGIGGFFAREQYEVTVEVADPRPRQAPPAWTPPAPVAVQADAAPARAPAPAADRPPLGLEALLAAAERAELSAPPVDAPAGPPRVVPSRVPARSRPAAAAAPAPAAPAPEEAAPAPELAPVSAFEAVFGALTGADEEAPAQAPAEQAPPDHEPEAGPRPAPLPPTGGLPAQRRAGGDGAPPVVLPDTTLLQALAPGSLRSEPASVVPDEDHDAGDPRAARDGGAPGSPTGDPGDPTWVPPWDPPAAEDLPWSPVAFAASPAGAREVSAPAAPPAQPLLSAESAWSAASADPAPPPQAPAAALAQPWQLGPGGLRASLLAPEVLHLPDEDAPAAEADPAAAPGAHAGAGPARPRGRRRAPAPLGEEDLAERLAALGVPARWLRHLPEGRGEALAFLTERIAATPLRARPRAVSTGAPVVAVLADVASALPVARQLAVALGMDATEVVLAHRKTAGVPREQCLPARADLLQRVQHARAHGRPLVAVLPAPVGAPQTARRALAGTVAAVRPDELWAVVDATRRLEDSATWLRGLAGGGGVDGVALVNLDATGAPGAALDLPAPVALLGDRPATPQAWVALLAARLTEQDMARHPERTEDHREAVPS